MGSRPPDFEALITRISGRLRERSIPFMLIGGQAVLLHGEPRLTLDIDITLGAAPDRLPDLLAVCDASGLDPLPEDVAAFVRETYVLPAAEESGIRVDFIFSTTPYEAQAIARAVTVLIGGEAVPFASAEDLLLHKLFAGRPRDLDDAAGVVRRKGEELDWDYLERWAEAFGEVPGRERMADAVRSLRSGAGPS
jgi:hypothetical protein